MKNLEGTHGHNIGSYIYEMKLYDLARERIFNNNKSITNEEMIDEMADWDSEDSSGWDDLFSKPIEGTTYKRTFPCPENGDDYSYIEIINNTTEVKRHETSITLYDNEFNIEFTYNWCIIDKEYQIGTIESFTHGESDFMTLYQDNAEAINPTLLEEVKNIELNTENLIIDKARKICLDGFMDYPDFDPETETTLADAVTIILAQHLPNTSTNDIYDLVEKLNEKQCKKTLL